MAQTVRSLLPLIEQTGVATAAEVGIDTLAARMREQAVAVECGRCACPSSSPPGRACRANN